MATNENLNGLTPFTLVASTAVGQFEAVSWNGSAVVHPASGARITGVVRTLESSGSTSSTPVATLYPPGSIAIVKAAGSTVSAGDFVSFSTAGYAKALASGDYCAGQVIAGSSGSTGRYLSVLIAPYGTT